MSLLKSASSRSLTLYVTAKAQSTPYVEWMMFRKNVVVILYEN